MNGSDGLKGGFFMELILFLFHEKWILRRASSVIFVIVCPQFVIGHDMRNFIKQHG